ncbi:cellulose-binding domain-containing protein, partial [Streptomyces sp. AK04-3B]|uniref:cellulose-binding domain-containing protein n=1 Tax=Streptomyces sp. AK04-3B TaxID=3028650 RepID=UPI0029B39F59
MRHPPRSVLLAFAGTAALVAGALLPVVTAQGAAPACTVEYSVTSQWDTGFQGAVKITNNTAAVSSWSLAFDFAGGQKVTQGWNAKWSQTGTTVTAANESWNGSLGTGASVSAGFIASKAGVNAVPAAFRLNGTICNAGIDPTPTPTPTPT